MERTVSALGFDTFCRNRRLRFFAESSHLPFAEEPEAFRRVLDGFLSDVDAA